GGLPRLDAAAPGAGDDGAAVGLEGVHPGVRGQPPQVAALTGVQGEQGGAVGRVDTAVGDRHRPGDVPGLEPSAAGGHVEGVHLEGGDVDEVVGDGGGAP